MERKLIGAIKVTSVNGYVKGKTCVNIEDGVYALYFKFRGESNLSLLDFELI